MPSLSSIHHVLKTMGLIMLMVAGRVQQGCGKVITWLGRASIGCVMVAGYRLRFGRGKVISQRRRTVIWCLQH